MLSEHLIMLFYLYKCDLCVLIPLKREDSQSPNTGIFHLGLHSCFTTHETSGDPILRYSYRVWLT